MSGGRIKIQFYGAGELIPAAEGFDAVSSGTVEMNYANSYFWTGKSFAAQYFTAVPFGLNFQGFNGWYYDGGGAQLWREVYDRFNLVPILVRQHRRADDRLVPQGDQDGRRPQGRQDAHPGPRRARLSRSSASTSRLIAPGEIFPNLERGVIDAAEFVGPFLDRQLGLHKVAKYYYTTGWHEMATASELIINKAKWNSLPADLKAIVENACAACNVISEAWCQKNNAEAMEDLVKNQGVIAQPLPDDVVKALRVATDQDSRRGGGARIRSPRRSTTPTWPTRPSTTPGPTCSETRLPHQDPQGLTVTCCAKAGRRDRRLHRSRRPRHRLARARLALVMGANVLLRYGFSIGSVWTQELEWHIMVPICLFGMSYALRHGEHVRVDVLFQYFSPRNKHLVDVITATARRWLSVAHRDLAVAFPTSGSPGASAKAPPIPAASSIATSSRR